MVSIWKVCRGVAAITAHTLAMYSSGMSLWNKSEVLLTKIFRGRVQRMGWSRRAGHRVTSKPFGYALVPENRCAMFSA